MIRSLLLSAGVATILIAAVPRVAVCGFPPVWNATIPSAIEVMGVNGAGAPDPGAAFEVIVRDLANNPVVNSIVWVDFTNCTDLRISHQSSGLVNPALGGQVLDCPTKTVRGVTDANGRVVLSVLGAGINAAGPSAAGPGLGCARLYADGILLGSATVHLYDQNGGAGTLGADGVEISDLSRWLEDFGSGIYVGRSDYGPSSVGVVSVDDLSLWLRRFGLGRSASGSLATGFCP